MQNDVIGDGGAFAASGAPAHAREQNVVENTRRLAAAARARGVAVIHVWFIVEPGAPGLTLERAAVRRDRRQQGDGAGQLGRGAGQRARTSTRRLRRREDAHERLGRHAPRDDPESPRPRHDHQHRRLDQHVDRAHGAHRRRQGLLHVVPEDCCSTMNAEWHRASINFALQNVAVVTNAEAVIRALG